MTWDLVKPNGWGVENYDDFDNYEDAARYLTNEGFRQEGYQGRSERWVRGEVVLLLRERTVEDTEDLRTGVEERRDR
jgi:hypothetical protein